MILSKRKPECKLFLNPALELRNPIIGMGTVPTPSADGWGSIIDELAGG